MDWKHVQGVASGWYTGLHLFCVSGRMASSVGEERKFNPRLTKTMEEFADIMNNLNLPNPKKMGKKKKNYHIYSSATNYVFQ